MSEVFGHFFQLCFLLSALGLAPHFLLLWPWFPSLPYHWWLTLGGDWKTRQPILWRGTTFWKSKALSMINAEKRVSVSSDTCSQFFKPCDDLPSCKSTLDFPPGAWLGFAFASLYVALTIYFTSRVVPSRILLFPQERKVAVPFFGFTDTRVALADYGIPLVLLNCFNDLIAW